MSEQGEEFEGRSGEMKVSQWLSSEDIQGQTVKVTVAACRKHKDVQFDQGRKEDTVFALEFKGKGKQLVLNSTNRKRMVELFGNNVKDWKDQEITLYVNENVRFAGKKVCGIRIK
jgi:hypothetical protein